MTMCSMTSTYDPDNAGVLIGCSGQARAHVTDADTASALGSGDLPVLGTPRMIALMEEAACAALLGRIPSASTTVGTQLDVRHSAPSPVGVGVVAHAEVIDVSGARITFRVRAEHDHDGRVAEIGHGTHVRVVVDRERFVSRL